MRRPAARRGGGRPRLDADVLRPALELVDRDTDAGADCELAVVVGGDGTILRAAEVTRASGTPLLGVNLGHVGFLAEAESDDVEATIDAIVERTLDARGPDDARRPRLPRRRAGHPHLGAQRGQRREGRPRADDRGRRRDRRPAAVAVGLRRGRAARRRPARRPTTSAPAGPIVWPEVEALLVVPISAHALFARPLVVAPDSVLAVEVIARTDGAGRAVVRRPPRRSTCRRAPGSRYAAADAPVRLARLHRGAVHRPAGRQVRPAGRGLARRGRAPPSRRRHAGGRAPMLEEIRIGAARRHRVLDAASWAPGSP